MAGRQENIIWRNGISESKSGGETEREIRDRGKERSNKPSDDKARNALKIITHMYRRLLLGACHT